jgi:Ca-activated chloride channel family protein
MSPRHQTSGLLKRVAVPVSALVGVIAVVGVTVVALRATAGPDCSGTLQLKIATAPATEEVVRRAADDYQGTRPMVGGKCVQVQVESRAAADMAHELPTARINPPALWIPDSSMWVAEAQKGAVDIGGDAPKLESKGSLASSPLVLAGSEKALSKLGTSSVSWRKVVEPGAQVALSDPTLSTEGLATLAVIRTLFGNADGTPKPELIDALFRVGRNALPSVRDAFRKVSTGADTAPVFTASEQSIVANNRAAQEKGVLASYPAEGTLSFDFPLVRVTRTSEPVGVSSAADGFERVLRSAQTATRFADAGFRDVDGKPSSNVSENDGVQPRDVVLMRPPPAEQVSELLRTWGAISLDARLLCVIDVSGSMLGTGTDGQTRIGVATGAALTALRMWPDTTQIGLWAFSTNKKPPNDWIELVSIGPLGEPIKGVTRRSALEQGASKLPKLVDGGTALYDTALAAFRTVKENYDASKVNSVVLITDGKNDDISSIDQKSLIDTLKREADPAKPIPMIMIGLTQEADMDALRQIAGATGGKAYQALRPEDIKTVLLDAISQRRCRPNC